MTAPTDKTDTITYPFPLRDGLTAYLHLPRRLLTPAEAAALVRFVEALAVKEEKE